MFETKEFHAAPMQVASRNPRPAAALPRPAHVSDPTAATQDTSNSPMLGAVRAMLGLALEAAFELRSGDAQSRYLDRFEEMLAQQTGLLDGLETAQFSSDPGLLTRRANEALNAFAAAVQEEIVDSVRPDIDPGAFHAALERMTDRAVVAGVAFASLDLALARTL